jgi:DNA-binding winged helix-turn-helix (wHTH) protein/DNA-binding CsgD family transcriptional regulator
MKTQRNGRDAEERQIKLLLVGSGDELNHDAARQLLSGNRLEIAGRSPNLLGALECLRSETIDLVLLGSEFRDEELALFIADARRHGFAGLLLRVASAQAFNPDSSGKVFSSALSTQELLEDPLHAVRVIHGTHQKNHGLDSSISFTAKERAVLAGVSEGSSNQQIALHLKCTEGSVKATLQQLFLKLGVRKRAQIVRVAFEKSLMHAYEKDRLAHTGQREFGTRLLSPTEFEQEQVIQIGDFVINPAMHRVWIRNVETHLSPKEFELLAVFCMHPEKLMRNTTLLEMFWRNPTAKQDSLRVLIRALRGKIETSRTPRYIVTERNFGYRFTPSPSRSGAAQG